MFTIISLLLHCHTEHRILTYNIVIPTKPDKIQKKNHCLMIYLSECFYGNGLQDSGWIIVWQMRRKKRWMLNSQRKLSKTQDTQNISKLDFLYGMSACTSRYNKLFFSIYIKVSKWSKTLKCAFLFVVMHYCYQSHHYYSDCCHYYLS